MPSALKLAWQVAMRQRFTGLTQQLRSLAIPWQESLSFSFKNELDKAVNTPAFMAVFKAMAIGADAILSSFQ